MATRKPKPLRFRGHDFAMCLEPNEPFLRRVLIGWDKGQPLGAHLDELRSCVRLDDAWRDLGPVFKAPNGLRWDESKFAKAWGRLMKHAVAAKVRPLHFHCARHTFASWALDAGRSIKWVQEMLGHSSAELTLRTYAHLMPSGEDQMGWLEGGRDEADGPTAGMPVRFPNVHGR